MSWIKILQIEIGEIKKYIEPRESVDAENEIPLGEANEEVKRLFTLRELLNKTGAEMAIKARFGETKEAREQAILKLHELKDKVETVNHNLWTSVHEQLGHWEKNIGIRKGFVVVILKPKPPSLMDFFNSL